MAPSRPITWTWTVVAAALVVKLVVLGQLHDHPLLRPAGVLDTAAYFELAQRAAAGDWALGPAAYYVSPLYIYFLAVVFRVSGAVALHAQVAQALLGAGAVALVARCAARIYGGRAAAIAAALTARGKERALLKRLTGHPMVRSVYRVSGEDCLVAEVVCRRIQDVSEILGKLQATRAVQSSRTAFVLEAVLEKGLLGPLEPALVEGDPEGAAPRPRTKRGRRP